MIVSVGGAGQAFRPIPPRQTVRMGVAVAVGTAVGSTVAARIACVGIIASVAGAVGAALMAATAVAVYVAVGSGAIIPDVGVVLGMNDGRAVPIADTDSDWLAVGTTVGAKSTPAGLVASGVPVATCNLLTSIGVARGADSSVASPADAGGVWVGATLTALPLSSPAGEPSHTGYASISRQSAPSQTLLAIPPSLPPVRRT